MLTPKTILAISAILIIVTKSLSEGVYLVQLIKSGQMLVSKRLIVIK